MPEEIVGDEDLVAGGREVPADRVDRPLADGSIHQLPDRTERASERTATRRFNQVGRAMVQAGIAAPPAGDEVPGRLRHVIKIEGLRRVR